MPLWHHHSPAMQHINGTDLMLANGSPQTQSYSKPLSIRTLGINENSSSNHPLVYRTTFTTITFDINEIVKTIILSVDELNLSSSVDIDTEMTTSRASTIKTPLFNVEEGFTVDLISESVMPLYFETEQWPAPVFPPSPESPPSPPPPAPPTPPPRAVDAQPLGGASRRNNTVKRKESTESTFELPMTRARARQLHTVEKLPKETTPKVATAPRGKIGAAFTAKQLQSDPSKHQVKKQPQLPVRKESLKRVCPSEASSSNAYKKKPAVARKAAPPNAFEDGEEMAELSQASLPPVTRPDDDDDDDEDDVFNYQAVSAPKIKPSTFSGPANRWKQKKVDEDDDVAMGDDSTTIVSLPSSSGVNNMRGQTNNIFTGNSARGNDYSPRPSMRSSLNADEQVAQQSASNIISAYESITTTTITTSAENRGRKPAAINNSASAVADDFSPTASRASIIIQSSAPPAAAKNRLHINQEASSSSLTASARAVRFAADTRFYSPPPGGNRDKNLMRRPVSPNNNSRNFIHGDGQQQQVAEDDGDQDEDDGNRADEVERNREMDAEENGVAVGDGGGTDSGVDLSAGVADMPLNLPINDNSGPSSRSSQKEPTILPSGFTQQRENPVSSKKQRAAGANAKLALQEAGSSTASWMPQNFRRDSSQQPRQQQHVPNNNVTLESVRQHVNDFDADVTASADEIARRTEQELATVVAALGTARNNTSLFGNHLRATGTLAADMRRAVEELNRPVARHNYNAEFRALSELVENSVEADNERISKLMEERLIAFRNEMLASGDAANAMVRLMAQTMRMQMQTTRQIMSDSSVYAGAVTQLITQARERMQQVYTRMMQDNVEMLNELGFDQQSAPPQQSPGKGPSSSGVARGGAGNADNSRRSTVPARAGGGRRT